MLMLTLQPVRSLCLHQIAQRLHVANQHCLCRYLKRDTSPYIGGICDPMKMPQFGYNSHALLISPVKLKPYTPTPVPSYRCPPMPTYAKSGVVRPAQYR